MEMMLLSTRMSLFFVAVLLFTGLTACEQTENAMDMVSQSEVQTVVTEEQRDGEAGEKEEEDERDDNGKDD